MIQVKILTPAEDLGKIVQEINHASWDSANEMSVYDVESLSAYLARPDTVFVTCHEISSDPPRLLGMASARLEIKPYGNELWLYIDEVDVCSDQRRKGAGKAMMQTLIAMAAENGCVEVWLGAEAENVAANALYRSLKPDAISQVVGYTFEIKE